MKKTAVAFIVAAVSLVCLSINTLPIVRIAKANPYYPPEWIILSPKNNAAYSPDNFNLSFIVISYDIEYDYYYTIDTPIAETPIEGPNGNGKILINATLISVTPGEGVSQLKTSQYSAELNGLSEGQHNLTLYYGYNFFTGWRREPASATIIFYITTSAPKITNLSINSQDKGNMLLNFTVDKATSWVGYSLDNQANVTVNGEFVLKDLTAGAHNVTVYAEDTAGKRGASETLLFTMAEPFPTTLAIASVASVAVVGVTLGLLVYRTEDNLKQRIKSGVTNLPNTVRKRKTLYRVAFFALILNIIFGILLTQYRVEYKVEYTFINVVKYPFFDQGIYMVIAGVSITVVIIAVTAAFYHTHPKERTSFWSK